MRADSLAPPQRTAGLVDVLDRVLDKGLLIAGDIRVSLAEVELLTIRIRLIVCSIDKAQGIDLITVEARVVVASIDTYLKYSEAVGQVTPVSKPAVEAARTDALLAENATLRSQLAAAEGGPRKRRVTARRPAPAEGAAARR